MQEGVLLVAPSHHRVNTKPELQFVRGGMRLPIEWELYAVRELVAKLEKELAVKKPKLRRTPAASLLPQIRL